MHQFLDDQAPRALNQQGTDAELASLITSTRKEERANLKMNNIAVHNKLKYMQKREWIISLH